MWGLAYPGGGWEAGWGGGGGGGDRHVKFIKS